MPTPDDETTAAIPPTPSLENSSSRASFASCPPEEDRERHAPQAARLAPPARRERIPSETVGEEHTTRQVPTPEPDAQPGAAGRSSAREARDKAEHVEDAGSVVAVLPGESPSPVGSPETASDSDVRLAQSMATAALSSPLEHVDTLRYLCYPPMNRNRVCQ